VSAGDAAAAQLSAAAAAAQLSAAAAAAQLSAAAAAAQLSAAAAAAQLSAAAAAAQLSAAAAAAATSGGGDAPVARASVVRRGRPGVCAELRGRAAPPPTRRSGESELARRPRPRLPPSRLPP